MNKGTVMLLDDRAWQIIDYYRWIAERSGQYVGTVSATRADVARHTGLSRTHVTRLMEKFWHAGVLVCETTYVNDRPRYRYWLSDGTCRLIHRWSIHE